MTSINNFCNGGHHCSVPKECCKQGCCFPQDDVYRPPSMPAGNMFTPLFLGHWYFWAAITATVAAILCACSLWRRHSSSFCCRDNGRDDRASEPDSNGSCYAPPQYSRCSSFHQAPPPYSEVTSKPDLYPLVISYNGDTVIKGNGNSTGYLMVQYFRNFIVRPVGTLSATSTIDSLSSSFICNAANEANTIIPPTYSCMGSLEEVNPICNTPDPHMPRSASSMTCNDYHHQATPTSPNIHPHISNGSIPSAHTSSVTSNLSHNNSNNNGKTKNSTHQGQEYCTNRGFVQNSYGHAVPGSNFVQNLSCVQNGQSSQYDPSRSYSPSGQYAQEGQSVQEGQSFQAGTQLGQISYSGQYRHSGHFGSSDQLGSRDQLNSNGQYHQQSSRLDHSGRINQSSHLDQSSRIDQNCGLDQSGLIDQSGRLHKNNRMDQNTRIDQSGHLDQSCRLDQTSRRDQYQQEHYHQNYTQNTSNFAQTTNSDSYQSSESIDGKKDRQPYNCDSSPSHTVHRVNRKLNFSVLSKDRSLDSESQEDDHNFSDLLNLSVCVPSSVNNIPLETLPSGVQSAAQDLQQSLTSSDISSLANLGTPDSPPRATSPTVEMRELLDKIQQLPQQKSPLPDIPSHHHTSKTKGYFNRTKAKTLYMPLNEVAKQTSNKISPGGRVGVFATTSTIFGKNSRSWLSRSAPNTPCGNFVPNFPPQKKSSGSQKGSKVKISDGSPLLNEHEESDEDPQKDECL